MLEFEQVILEGEDVFEIILERIEAEYGDVEVKKIEYDVTPVPFDEKQSGPTYLIKVLNIEWGE